MATNRVCKVCGKEYEYCPSCPKARNKEKFMIMFCGDNWTLNYEKLDHYVDNCKKKNSHYIIWARKD